MTPGGKVITRIGYGRVFEAEALKKSSPFGK
jgi:hypothetical protein